MRSNTVKMFKTEAIFINMLRDAVMVMSGSKNTISRWVEK